MSHAPRTPTSHQGTTSALRGINVVELARLYRNVTAFMVLIVFMVAYTCDLYAHFYNELDFSWFTVCAIIITSAGCAVLGASFCIPRMDDATLL
jgi:hypothetical protein